MAKDKKVQEETAALKKIIFVASPTGFFDLAYSAGEIGEFDARQAKEIVESGYGNYYEPEE